MICLKSDNGYKYPLCAQIYIVDEKAIYLNTIILSMVLYYRFKQYLFHWYQMLFPNPIITVYTDYD